MAQQQNNRTTRLVTLLVFYGIFTFFWFQFMQPKKQDPAQQGSILQQAQQLEADGRKADPNVALSDRVKKLDQAAGKYEQFYKSNDKSPEGFQARFQQVNVYDYLAALEGKKSGTHWFDVAETKLKEMEKQLHNKSGEVKLEDNRMEGNAVVTTVRTENGELGKIASARLNQIRAGRDVINREKITYKTLDALVKATGAVPAYSYFVALAFVVIVLKAATFPFQKKQYQYQRDLMRVQPKVKAMQDEMKAKGRPQEEISRRMMELYKEENVNLAGGCLPMLVMMVVLFPVFYMVRDYEYQFTNATFLWIGSEYSKQQWWLADNLAQFDVPMFVVYLFSTVAYSLLQPKPADPQQAQQQKMMLVMMPAIFGVMMWQGQWSSAFMLYWLVLNLVSMYQSWSLMRTYGMNTPEALAAADAAAGKLAPATPLEPMKGVHNAKPNNGRKGRGQARVRRKGPQQAD